VLSISCLHDLLSMSVDISSGYSQELLDVTYPSNSGLSVQENLFVNERTEVSIQLRYNRLSHRLLTEVPTPVSPLLPVLG